MIGYYNKIINKKQLGLSILEAMMATAVVGIGFVAVFKGKTFKNGGREAPENLGYIKTLSRENWSRFEKK